MFLGSKVLGRVGLILTLAVGVCPLEVQAADLDGADGAGFFERSVRPLLAEHCYECHSARSKQLKGALRLDTPEALLKGGEAGPVVIAGAPEKSLLIKAVRYLDKDLQMPPKRRLEASQVATLEQWVRLGAPVPNPTTATGKETNAEHWAFRPLRPSPPPSVRNGRCVNNDVDAFVLARLEANGLQPGPLAGKHTLIRRATYDITGLPPAPGEIEEFLRDRSDSAFVKVIDRLLASPRYGERWGRFWLDLARYADTAGDSADFPIPQAYKYRNYVIDAFNQDKPYDQFIREQIAGDLLPCRSEQEKREHIIATGFLAQARRFGVEPDAAPHLMMEDALDTMSKSVLGLSLSCARCHDHKYDPIPMRDYYGLYGILQSTRFPYAGSENKKHQRDFVTLIEQAEVREIVLKYSAALAQVDGELRALEEEEAKADEAQNKAGTNTPETKDFAQLIGQAKRRQRQLLLNPPLIDTAYAVSEGTPGNAKLQKRGEPSALGEEVPRHFLTVLGGQQLPQEEKGSGRLALAQWLTDMRNPLTARVMVNRIWQHHFGKGLVGTSSDFGTRGQSPSHPELLDYLASKFMREGWSVKALQRTILLSRTYQEASVDTPEGLKVDPRNLWLWKFNRQRLDAEELRDSLLWLGGGLDYSIGAAHPFPPEPKWEFTQHSAFAENYKTRHRSVYVMQQRIRKHPYFGVFDGPDPNTTTAERGTDATPMQALFFMNDKFAHEQSLRFAERLTREHPATGERIRTLYQLALGRPPSRVESSEAGRYVLSFRQQAEESQISKEETDLMAWASLARALTSGNEFNFVE